MRSLDDMIQRARRLSARDRRKLVRALADPDKGTHAKRSRKRRALVRPLYESLLALAGTGHGLATDVASDKYRHLGAAYRDARDE